MSTPLIATKLHPPPLFAGCIERPALLARLNTITARLILIVAPPGFGKTTLATSWLRDQAHTSSFAWLSLDPRDNDPTRFWGTLLAALARSFPGFGDHARSMLASPQAAPLDVVIAALVEELDNLARPCLLVLDDYHLIENPGIHTHLATLIEHLPATTRLLILSRSEPPLPLGRLRMHGQLCELHTNDLRFSAAEVRAFLQSHGLQLSAEDVAILNERSEGWPGALQLAVLSLRSGEPAPPLLRALRGSNRHLVDYLAEEVLARQSSEYRRFLLATCLVDALCRDLCAALLPDLERPAADVLEAIERAGLFLQPLDQERRWYRYHALFAEFLRERLLRDDPGYAQILHQRAAAWYADAGMPVEAIGHLLAAKAYTQAAMLIEQEGRPLLLRSEVATVLDWLRALPSDLAHARPGLCLIEAWTLAVAGQFDAVEIPLARVSQMLAADDPDTPTSLSAPFTPRNLRSEVLAVRATVAGLRRDTEATLTLAQAALAEIPDDSVIVRSVVALMLGSAAYLRGDMAAAEAALNEAARAGQAANLTIIAIFALRQLGELAARIGQLHRAARTYQEALDLGERLYPASGHQVGRPVPVAGTAYIGLAQLHYEWNDLESAERLLADGLRLGRQGANVEILLMGPICLARVQVARGEHDTARSTIADALAFARSTGVPRLAHWLDAEQARLAIMLGDLAEASAWDQARRLAVDDALSYLEEIDYLVLVHLRLVQGHLEPARHLLGRLRSLAESQGRHSSLIEIGALESLVYAAQGETATARSHLLRTLRSSIAEGYLRTFADLGPPMATLLQDLRPSLANLPHERPLLDAIDRILAACPAKPQVRMQPTHLIEPLTPRELEVIGLVAAGLSNQEIAERMVVGVSTVKKHINNIYGKLDVLSRTQALKKAREFGLIS
ncbi:TPR repeat-containing transcriptional regulator LuxR [Oscillochloris trichoides DG-6]|uniref:TPR repeat-containing transcriptional regulator LuxR n=1 Tax=Oscillochloris trichoides DG-6 TaxID=765420 RepID=E1IG17_9CHLR|nr:LuxR C-terminal-related transcriptional regulator [Oscillochloris trichoides]EFO79906.1 TPR repeat-containing transcriptional regulator LuxR [Oscillochloris trichoides DG-6]